MFFLAMTGVPFQLNSKFVDISMLKKVGILLF